MAKLKTGRHTSALKAQRHSLARLEANTQVRSKIRTIARQVEEAAVQKNLKLAKDLLNEAFSLWDKAAKSGVIHVQTASRKKSRLAQRVHAIQPAEAKR